MQRLYDMHVHINKPGNAARLLCSARNAKISLLVMTCSVDEYLRLLPQFKAVPPGGESILALGLHPWRIACEQDIQAEITRFEQLACDADAFGELGLDFHNRHTDMASHAQQLKIFERACTAAATSAKNAGKRKPLSLHTLKAADETLDILERTHCLEYCACILHWFSGSVPQLERAREAGCWFSFNERQLKTGKGREYAKLIPPDRLLLETDLPVHDNDSVTANAIATSLKRTLALLEEILRRSPSEQIAKNARSLLS